MRTFPLALLIALALTAASQAQGFTEFGAALTVGVPQGSFAEGVGDAPAFGLSAHALVHLGRAPVALGAEASYRTYGMDWDEGYTGTTTTNNIAQVLGVLRLQERRGGAEPYAEALAGFSYLFTENGFYDEDYEPIHLLGDAAFVAGLGGGVTVPVYQSVGFDVRLDVRVRYLIGGSARYFTPGDVLPDGYVVEPPQRSTTDLFAPHVGVAFRF